MRIEVPALCATLLCLSLPAAADDSYDHRYQLGVGYSHLDPDSAYGASGTGGIYVNFGRALNEDWSLEVAYHKHSVDVFGPVDADVRSIDLIGLYFFDRARRFSPFLLAGVGNVDSDLAGNGFDLAVGAGFLARINDNVAFRADMRLRDGNTSPGTDDMLYNIGLQIALGAAAAPPPPMDTDGDGVMDGSDSCPRTPAGTEVDARGCAIVRDGDGDGIVDHADACPRSPRGSEVDARGCPLDGDRDGVPDSTDRCPATPAGTEVQADGCAPRVLSLDGVNFETASADLTASSRGILDGVARTLVENPGIRAEVAGHTDSAGRLEFNTALSQARAESVMRYLVAAGVAADRLTAHGYGPSEPVASNDTADGRAQNRRVELRVIE